MLDIKNKENSKGIRITEDNIKSWKRNKKTGERKYSNTLAINKEMYKIIDREIKGTGIAEDIVLYDSNKAIKFEMNVSSRIINVKQYNVPFSSGLRHISIKI